MRTLLGWMCYRIVMAWPGAWPSGAVAGWILAWADGRHDDIAHYCKADVDATRACWQKLT